MILTIRSTWKWNSNSYKWKINKQIFLLDLTQITWYKQSDLLTSDTDHHHPLPLWWAGVCQWGRWRMCKAGHPSENHTTGCIPHYTPDCHYHQHTQSCPPSHHAKPGPRSGEPLHTPPLTMQALHPHPTALAWPVMCRFVVRSDIWLLISIVS